MEQLNINFVDDYGIYVYQVDLDRKIFQKIFFFNTRKS